MGRLARNICLLAAVVSSGCGTMGNMAGPGGIYGGVYLDGKAVCDAGRDLANQPEGPQHTVCNDVAIMIFRTLDVPLSAVVDTFTLPLTTTRTICNWLKGESAPPDFLAPTK